MSPDATPSESNLSSRYSLDTAALIPGAGPIPNERNILPEIAAAPPGIPCYSSTATSPVVKVFYLYPRGTKNRLEERRTAIREAIGYADLMYALSAQRTGGIRHVRWLMASGCKLAITAIAISPSLSFDATRRYLIDKGLLTSTQKALAFREAKPCMGLGERARDDRPTGANRNNRGGTLASVLIQPCLDDASDPMDRAYVYASLGFGAAHEFAHSLGAVQPSAPHSTAGGHCTDVADVMCYVDGPGVKLHHVCEQTFPALFDCGNDDYFDTSPEPGSYLATHWNIARNRFLATREPGEWDRLPRPTIAFTSLQDGSTLDDGAPVAFGAGFPSDGAAIAAIALLVDGWIVGVDRVAPYSLPLDGYGFSPGQPVPVQAVVFDALGRQASTPLISVVLGNGAWVGIALTIESPQANTAVGGPFQVVVGWPSDNSNVSASVYVNGRFIGTVTPGVTSLIVDPVAIGADFGDDLTIRVVADDDSGIETTTTVVFLPV
jgi:hypothetical protein